MWYIYIYIYIYHIFFIHPSVDGHLGSFYVLAVVNSTAMNSGVYASFRIMFLLQINAQEWDGRVLFLVLIFFSF